MEIPMNPAPNSPEQNQYMWPCYWGGLTVSKAPPQIHEGLRDLRRAVGSLAAKKQQGGPMFPVRSAKELMQKLAEALDELSLHAFPVAQEVHHFETGEGKIPSNATASGKPVFRTLAHVKTTVRVGAADGSYIDVVGSGHGGDVDDKAGGKADTYAWKSALLKGLCVPEQDMPDTDDEAPSESAGTLKPSGAGPKPQKVPPAETNESQLDAALARIVKADRAELAAIKEDIKSGKLPLAGADKLKASAKFVARGKELDAEDAAAIKEPK